MARNFENWLDAYLHYADDSFTPKQFNLWSGISAIAGALERKVWLPWSDTFSFYPNMYVFLVGKPGAGKSVSLNKAVGLLQELHNRNGSLKLMPSQVTEAKFIELMGMNSSFQIGNKIYSQSAGYYWASEASNSLRNIYGDFIACLTDFYDCPPLWEKATLKDGKITLTNVCLNLIAGCTFDHLGKIVTAENIMGGFASRIIYVVQREQVNKNQKFQLGGAADDTNGARAEFRRKLVEDLTQIHEMVGPFRASPEFGAAWEKWYPEFEARRQRLKSEKMQSLITRTNGNTLKLAMLLSAAESNDRVLKLHHWERALSMSEEIEAEIPKIFREAQAGDTSSQNGMMQFIARYVDEVGRDGYVHIPSLKMALSQGGFDTKKSDNTVDLLIRYGGFTQSDSRGYSKLAMDFGNHI